MNDTHQPRPFALGIDLGATKTELALVDPDGRIGGRVRIDTAVDPDRALAELTAAARRLLGHTRDDGAQVTAVGVGVAGQVDPRAGVLRTSPNLRAWRDVPIAGHLSEALGLPVAIINDLDAITLGEQAFGAGRELDGDRGGDRDGDREGPVDDLVVIYVGTGVGGGVISGGSLIEGAGGFAGELGHITVVADGRRCSCPNRGCLEAYVGGWAIAERAREAIADDPEAGVSLLRTAGRSEDVTAETVARAAAAGDPLARRLVEETGRFLGAGLVSAVHTFNPRRIVLGGGVIDGIPSLVPAAAAVVRERTMAVFREDLEIVPAALGSDAGVVGAARLAQLLIEPRTQPQTQLPIDPRTEQEPPLRADPPHTPRRTA